MQLLSHASNAAASEEACARALLDTVPLVMKTIREQMRRHRSGLTVPQFRTLCFVRSAMGNSLSSVADFIGLSLPAMSRLVDGLVDKHLMTRRPSDDDRRHVRLGVTTAGKAAIDEARQLAQAHMAKALTDLTPRQRTTVAGAMQTLRSVFAPDLPDGSTADAAFEDR